MLMRADEVAILLDLSRDRVYSLARQGIIPCVQIGRQVRFSQDQLSDFITSGGKKLPVQKRGPVTTRKKRWG